MTGLGALCPSTPDGATTKEKGVDVNVERRGIERGMLFRARVVLVAGILTAGAFGVVGCGSDDDAGTTTVETAAAAGANVVPVELSGTYERTVPDGLAGGVPPGLWKLAIGPMGEFFNVPPGETGFFNSPLAVDGDTIEIPMAPEAGCTSRGSYTYVLAGPRPGGTLTFKLVKDEFCEARAALLTSGPWERTD